MNKNRVFALLLAAAIGGCSPSDPVDDSAITGSAAPVAADARHRKQSDNDLFVVELASGVSPVPMNRIHSWVITVTAPDGTPVTGARLSFDGGMPDHNHGFPTVPRVHGETGPGRYRIDGVKFSMSGWWRMEIGIAAGEQVDVVAFDLAVGP